MPIGNARGVEFILHTGSVEIARIDARGNVLKENDVSGSLGWVRGQPTLNRPGEIGGVVARLNNLVRRACESQNIGAIRNTRRT